MKYPAFALLFFSLAAPLSAADGWTFQASVGAVANLETPLEIRQDGSEDIELDAEYETRPFEGPLYYSLRAGHWRGTAGWELELIHQKLFLKNRPPEVEQFAISHGYNLITLNRAWDRRRLLWRLGAGVVLAHPENRVRGRSLPEEGGLFDTGYHLTGPVLQGAVEKRFDLGTHWYLGLEGKVTAARAEVPVAEGEAEVPNIAGHVLLGVGVR